MKKKLLAILLALGLVITCMPMMAAFAATEINENPLSFTKGEGDDEGKYILTFTVPKAIYNQKIYSYQFGFTFDKGAFEICERYDADEGGNVTDLTHNFTAKLNPTITGRDTINKNGSVGISGAASESATFNKDISITMKFNKKAGADLDQASAFVINDYKIWSTDPEKPIACLTSDQDADTAAYTLDADRFAVAANSAEGTAEHTHTYTVGDYVWKNLDDPETVSCTATKTCTDENCSGEGKTVTETVTMGKGIEKKEEKAATCTEKGNMTYTANFVDADFTTQIKSADILASGHTLLHHDKMEATEIADGNIEYWECSKCNKNFSDAEGTIKVTDITIPKTGAKYTVTYTIERCGVPENKEITGYLCKKDSDYSTDITDDQFRKEKTGLQENEIKKATINNNEVYFGEVTVGKYILVILGDETTRSTRVDVDVIDRDISGQAKLYLFGDVNEDNEVNMEDVKMFMSVIVGNSEFDDKIKPALGYKVPGLPRAVDITDARRSMGV